MWGALQLGVDTVRRGRHAAVSEALSFDRMGGVVTALTVCAVASAVAIAACELGWPTLRQWLWRRSMADDASEEADGSGALKGEEGELSDDGRREKRRVDDGLRDGVIDPVVFYDVGLRAPTPPRLSPAVPLARWGRVLCRPGYAAVGSEGIGQALLSRVTVGVPEQGMVALYSPASPASSALTSLLLRPSRHTGRLLVDGVDAHRERGEVARKLGVVEDGEAGEEEWLTAAEVCGLYARVKGMGEEEGAARAASLLAALSVRQTALVGEDGSRGAPASARRTRPSSPPRALLLVRGVWGRMSAEEARDVWRVVREDMGRRDRLLVVEDGRREVLLRAQRVVVLGEGGVQRVLGEGREGQGGGEGGGAEDGVWWRG